MESTLKKEILSINEIEEADSKLKKIMQQIGHVGYVQEMIHISSSIQDEPRLEKYQEKLLLGFRKFYSKANNFQSILLCQEYSEIWRLILESNTASLVFELVQAVRKNALGFYEHLVSNLTDESGIRSTLSVLFYFVSFQNEQEPKVYNMARRVFLEISGFEMKTNSELCSNCRGFFQHFEGLLNSEDAVVRMRALELVVEMSVHNSRTSQLFFDRGVTALGVKLYKDSQSNLLEVLNSIEILSSSISVKVGAN